MKTLKTSLIFVLFCFNAFSQNGNYLSTKFEFISENNPSINRVENKKNLLTIQINEYQDQFLGGRILWELRENNYSDSEFLEISLNSLMNSYYEQNSKAHIKVFNGNILLMGRVVDKVVVYIWKFTGSNTYRVDLYDPSKKTTNRFDNISKLSI